MLVSGKKQTIWVLIGFLKFCILDCVVAHLCFTMLLVYEASTVEEIDVVSLNCLSRRGACSCMDVSTVAMALLSR